MSYRLRPQQLEARVLGLIDLVLEGGRIEDDLVECKGQWPDPQKRPSVRQLAGAANKARGEPILWIIGLDEDAHTLTEVRSVDVAEWWSAMSSRFDPPAPELEHHIGVPVGEGKSVTALRFLTDRSPYVILSGGEDGRLEREVPIRDGTRTRSARRDELLRLLIPAVAPPAAQLLSASLTMIYSRGGEGTEGYTTLDLMARVFLEQPAMSAGVVMLPDHQMHGRIDYGSRSFRWELQNIMAETEVTTFGVDRRPDGVVVTGPGTLIVGGGEKIGDGDHRSMSAEPSGVHLHLSFGVAGIDRRIRLDAELDAVPRDAGSSRVEWQLNVPSGRSLGRDGALMRHWWDRGPVLGMVAWIGLFLLYVAAGRPPRTRACRGSRPAGRSAAAAPRPRRQQPSAPPGRTSMARATRGTGYRARDGQRQATNGGGSTSNSRTSDHSPSWFEQVMRRRTVPPDLGSGR